MIQGANVGKALNSARVTFLTVLPLTEDDSAEVAATLGKLI